MGLKSGNNYEARELYDSPQNSVRSLTGNSKAHQKQERNFYRIRRLNEAQ